MKLNENTKKLKAELEEAMEANDYAKCESINRKLNANFENFKKIGNETYPIIEATEEDILEAIGEIVGVQMTRLDEDKTKFLREMPDEIKKYVIGQDDAVDTIVKNIRRNQLGLRKTSHSAGNFMFIGSTGVGKTYLAKQLAKYLYGSEDALLRLDMSEFQAEIDVSKLLGSAPGYVGYKESGLLVKGLAKNGETVVLFDEIEKAHPDVFNVLLQVLDDGRITDSQGRTVDFKNTILIMTSNIGSPYLLDGIDEKGDIKPEAQEQVMNDLRGHFRPEFLNRLDETILFKPLTKDNIGGIIHLIIADLNKRLEDKQLTIRLSDEAMQYIVDNAYDPVYGARPLKRYIQKYVETLAAKMILADQVDEGDTIVITVEDDKLSAKCEKGSKNK